MGQDRNMCNMGKFMKCGKERGIFIFFTLKFDHKIQTVFRETFGFYIKRFGVGLHEIFSEKVLTSELLTIRSNAAFGVGTRSSRNKRTVRIREATNAIS